MGDEKHGDTVDSAGRWREHCNVASIASARSKSVNVGNGDSEDAHSEGIFCGMRLQARAECVRQFRL